MNDDEELSLLMAELDEIQVPDKKFKSEITEKNTIDLVTRMIQLGILDVSLENCAYYDDAKTEYSNIMKKIVYTLTGKEFITYPKLIEEITLLILENGGRMRIDALSYALNIEMNLIEKVVTTSIISAQVVLLYGTDVVMKSYVEDIAAEMNEQLEFSNVLSIADLATRYSVPVPFILECIENGIRSKRIHGNLKLGVLESTHLAEEKELKTIAALGGCTVPMPLSVLSEIIGIDTIDLEAILAKVIPENRIFGAVQSGLYVPDVYSLALHGVVDAEIETPRYIFLRRFKMLNMSSDAVLRFVCTKHPDAILLDSCIVSFSFLETILTTIADEPFVIDVRRLVPDEFTDQDIVSIIDKLSIKVKRTEIHVFCDSIVVMNAVVDEAKRFVCNLAKKDARAWALQKFQREVNVVKAHKVQQLVAKESHGLSCDIKRISGEIIKHYPLFESKSLSGEFFEEFAGSLVVFFDETITVAVKQLSKLVDLGEYGVKRHYESELSELFKQLFMEFTLYEKYTNMNTAFTPCIARLLLQLIGILVEFQCCTGDIPFAQHDLFESFQEHVPGTVIKSSWVSTQQLLSTIKDLPNETFAESLRDLIIQLDSAQADPGEISCKVQSLAEECSFVIWKVDKKIEKQISLKHRQALLDKLGMSNNPQEVFVCACCLLQQQIQGSLIPILAIGDSIDDIAQALRETVLPVLETSMDDVYLQELCQMLDDPSNDEHMHKVRKLAKTFTKRHPKPTSKH